jgi:hypothetical protein
MLFVKSFKGYEDKPTHLDDVVNEWILQHKVDVVSVLSAMSHEPDGRAKMGDLIYTVVYRADRPIA